MKQSVSVQQISLYSKTFKTYLSVNIPVWDWHWSELLWPNYAKSAASSETSEDSNFTQAKVISFAASLVTGNGNLWCEYSALVSY